MPEVQLPPRQLGMFPEPQRPGQLLLPERTAPDPAIDLIIARLTNAVIGDTFNQYASDPSCRTHLASYLSARSKADIALVGEAAGYRGARLTGIPFTSPAQLGTGATSEASATIVHRVLADLGAEERVVLWNVVPTHPHHPGQPASNRAPSAAEVTAGREFITMATAGRRLVAVGQVAKRALGGAVPVLRHPSHGGAREFAAGLAAILAGGEPPLPDVPHDAMLGDTGDTWWITGHCNKRRALACIHRETPDALRGHDPARIAVTRGWWRDAQDPATDERWECCGEADPGATPFTVVEI